MIKYKRIGIFVGHSKLKNGNYTSADGRPAGKLEYAVCKEVAYEVKAALDRVGQPSDVIVCPEGVFASKYEEDDYKLPIANSGKYDLIIELHLNSYNGSAHGCEVLCYPASNSRTVGQRVQNRLKTQFYDRKIKDRNDLYMLTKTRPTAIMIESFFCDNVDDCRKYDQIGKANLGRLIAEGLVDTTIPSGGSTGGDYQVGDFQGKVRITADVLNVRTGRGPNFPVVVNHSDGRKIQFTRGQIVDVWYIDKYTDPDTGKVALWGSCPSGAKDANGKPITGFIHMGYTERV